MNRYLVVVTSLLMLCSSLQAQAEFSVRGLLQAQYAVTSDNTPSYLQGGTGLLRFDEDNQLQLAHAILEFKGDISDHVSFQTVLNATDTPDSHAGLTQFFLRYKPIWSSKYRWQFRAGMFYPEMGFENPDIGWLSPYAYSNSAISAWIGEEVRTLGGEFKVTRPGRSHGSAHTFALTGSVYKGNDPAGTLLAWRGWAIHDKQTIVNERVFFADYPTIGEGQPLAPQAEWVEPFREIDGRYGYKIGLHWDFQKKSRMRYYYYNNNADETILSRGGQYAWHTIFHSLAWQYRFDRNWRFITQLMDGNTAMGPGAVNVDFSSWYGMLNYRSKPHGVTLRYDWFDTTDKDSLIPNDDSSGQGNAITGTYRYTLNKNWQIGTEYVRVNSSQASRAQFAGQKANLDQDQLLLITQYRF